MQFWSEILGTSTDIDLGCGSDDIEQWLHTQKKTCHDFWALPALERKKKKEKKSMILQKKERKKERPVMTLPKQPTSPERASGLNHQQQSCFWRAHTGRIIKWEKWPRKADKASHCSHVAGSLKFLTSDKLTSPFADNWRSRDVEKCSVTLAGNGLCQHGLKQKKTEIRQEKNWAS